MTSQPPSPSTTHTPLVSVVMPVYNGEQYMQQTMDSILSQTFPDFEFLIVNDGSTDGTAVILDEYAAKDSRVVVVHQENRGKVATRNVLCALTRGKYVAVTDSDDISFPKRLELEVAFMEDHPEVGVVGTWTDVIDQNGKVTKTLYHPQSSDFAAWLLYFRNPISHSSALIRRTAGEEVGWYRDFASDDYDLWSRISARHAIANIPKVLVQYRMWAGNFTLTHEGAEEATARTVIRERSSLLLGEDVPEADVRALRLVMEGARALTLDQVRLAAALCRRLYYGFVGSRQVSPEDKRMIRNQVSEYFCLLARHAKRYSRWQMLLLYGRALTDNPLFAMRVLR